MYGTHPRDGLNGIMFEGFNKKIPYFNLTYIMILKVLLAGLLCIGKKKFLIFRNY